MTMAQVILPSALNPVHARRIAAYNYYIHLGRKPPQVSQEDLVETVDFCTTPLAKRVLRWIVGLVVSIGVATGVYIYLKS